LTQPLHKTARQPARSERADGSDEVPTTQHHTRARFFVSQHLPKLLLLPTVVLTAIFVYGFIAFSIVVSISNWNSFGINLNVRSPWYQTYLDLFANPRFQIDLRNQLIFTVLFLILTTFIGLVVGILVHNVVIARGFFRTLFLAPYALSFIVAGVVWRWLFNPETGVNLLFDILGVNGALKAAGMEPLKPGWMTDPSVVLSINDALGSVIPPLRDLGLQLGIPVALIPIVIAASWQVSGFAMAMTLAGLGTVPVEMIEAARVDGASSWQVYTRVVVPMLAPTIVSTLVILGWTSLKIFDLVVAMSGSGPGFATDVPGIFVYELTFQAFQYNTGAAASIMMLLAVAIVVVPYLTHTYNRQEDAE